MNKFIGFVKKEFLHIFRDVRTMLVLFGIPIAQLLIFGYVVNTDIKDIRIAIYDPSKDVVSLDISNKLISSGYFLLEENLDNINDVESIFKKGNVKVIVVFEPNFANRLRKEKTANIQILADASDANMASLIVNYTTGIIQNYMKDRNQFAEIPIQIQPKVRMVFNEEMKSVYMFVPGTMALILMLISAMMTSISIAREKELGTMEVLLVSPLHPVQIIIGKVIPYVLISFINAIIIILLGHYIFGMPINGSIALLLAESFLFICMALSLGIFISTLSKNQQVAMFISLFALMLPTILLSGFIFPTENMPIALQWLSYAMPPKYFIIIVKNIMLKGVGFMYVWKETLVLVGMMLAFIALSVKKFKLRLE